VLEARTLAYRRLRSLDSAEGVAVAQIHYIPRVLFTVSKRITLAISEQ
jgi:hypothetical protein